MYKFWNWENWFHSDVEIFNKECDKRYQIYKGDQLDKKSANVEDGLTGSTEVLKLGIMIYKICIDKDSDERDYRCSDGQIEKNSWNRWRHINWWQIIW